MKILITGGAGFIGTHTSEECIRRNYDVVIVDDLSTGKKERINKKAKFYEVDICSEEIDRVFATEKPDYVIHLAAQVNVTNSISNPLDDANRNILGTINILSACNKYEVKRIIFSSTAAVYGNPQYLPIDENHPTSPISNYGLSKITAENYIRLYSELYKLKHTILRYANVYGVYGEKGTEGGVISIFMSNLLSNEPYTVFGDGEQTRDYIYVTDVVEANLSSLDSEQNLILNVGTGIKITLNELVAILNDISNSDASKIKYEEARIGDIKDSFFDISKLSTTIESKQVSLKNGLATTYEYYRKK